MRKCIDIREKYGENWAIKSEKMSILVKYAKYC